MPNQTEEFEAAFGAIKAAKVEASASIEQPGNAPAADAQANPPGESPDDAAVKVAPHNEPANQRQADSVDDLRRQLTEAQHRERSASSRMSARDRQSNAVAQENARLKAQLEALQKPAPKPAAQEPQEPDVLDDAKELEEAVNVRVRKQLKPFEEQMAAANARAAAAEEAAARANGFIQPIVDDRAAKAVADVHTHLNDNFGGWQEAVSQKNEQFHGWLDSQPDAIRSLFEHGKTVADTSAVLTLYSAQTGHQFTRKQSAAADAGADKRTANSSSALRNAVGLPSRPAGSSARPDPSDFDGAFAEFQAMKRK